MFDTTAASAMRDAMTPLDFTAAAQPSELEFNYLDFYGLGFVRSLGLKYHRGYFNTPDFKLSCQYFEPPSQECVGTIFMVHGYYDHGGLYGHLIEYFLQRQFRLVAFDLPGHGLSSGEPAAIRSFDQYYAALSQCVALAQAAELPKPWHIIGQSTGCSVIMDYCLRDCAASESQFDEVVLLAPLVRPYQWWRGRLLHFLLEPFVDSLERQFVSNSGDLEFLDFVSERDPLQSRRLSAKWVRALKNWMVTFAGYAPCSRRLSVLQGLQDRTVDWPYNLKAIKAKFPNMQSDMLSGARHHLVNESPEIRKAIFAILDRVVPDSSHA